jgi:hypothetical protein
MCDCVALTGNTSMLRYRKTNMARMFSRNGVRQPNIGLISVVCIVYRTTRHQGTYFQSPVNWSKRNHQWKKTSRHHRNNGEDERFGHDYFCCQRETTPAKGQCLMLSFAVLSDNYPRERIKEQFSDGLSRSSRRERSSRRTRSNSIAVHTIRYRRGPYEHGKT